MYKPEKKFTPGYCLEYNIAINLFYNGQVGPPEIQPTGQFYHCPHCGILDSIELGNAHIWNPSKKLLERLNVNNTTI